MLEIEKTTFIGTKEIKYKVIENQLVNSATVDGIWSTDYGFERPQINLLREFRSPSSNKIKCFFHTVELRYDLVRNEILSKNTNSMKTFLTHNTQMFYAYTKKILARPLALFKTMKRYISDVSGRLSDFYNVTGDTVNYTLYLFNNIVTANYSHNLTEISYAKKTLKNNLKKGLQETSLKYKKILLVFQPYKRRKRKLRLGGYKQNLFKRLKKVKFFAYKVFQKGHVKLRYVIAKKSHLKAEGVFCMKSLKQYFVHNKQDKQNKKKH